MEINITKTYYFIHVVLILIQFYQHCIAMQLEQCNEKICISLPDDYNNLIRPYINETNQINLWINHLKILKVNDYDSTITLSLTLSVTWKEPRLIAPKEGKIVFTPKRAPCGHTKFRESAPIDNIFWVF